MDVQAIDLTVKQPRHLNGKLQRLGIADGVQPRHEDVLEHELSLVLSKGNLPVSSETALIAVNHMLVREGHPAFARPESPFVSDPSSTTPGFDNAGFAFIRSLDAAMFTVCLCAAALLILLLATEGVVFLQDQILPPLLTVAAVIAFVAVLAVPLFFVPRLRPSLRYVFAPASTVLGFAAWSHAFILTARFAGPAGLAVGLCLAGVGVVAIGPVAAALAGDFVLALVCLALIFVAAAVRLLSGRISASSTAPFRSE